MTVRYFQQLGITAQIDAYFYLTKHFSMDRTGSYSYNKSDLKKLIEKYKIFQIIEDNLDKNIKKDAVINFLSTNKVYVLEDINEDILTLFKIQVIHG